MYNTILWLSDNRVYLAKWAAALALCVAVAAMFLFATKWLIVAFAIAIAVAGFTQIDKREFFNAGVAFAVALFIAVVGYIA